MVRVIYNPVTGAEFPLNRRDDQPVVGLQPPLVVVRVIETIPVEPPGFFAQPAGSIYDAEAGTLERQWTLEPLTDPGGDPDYQAFYIGVLNSDAYQQALVPMLLTSNSAALAGTMAIFGFAIQDAMAGRVSANEPGAPNSLQSAIWLLMQVAGPQLSSGDLQELQGLLDASGMATTYALLPPTP